MNGRTSLERFCTGKWHLPGADKMGSSLQYTPITTRYRLMTAGGSTDCISIVYREEIDLDHQGNHQPLIIKLNYLNYPVFLCQVQIHI